MTSVNDILDGINRLLDENYPTYPVCVKDTAKAPERPFFGLNFEKQAVQDATASIVQVTAHYVITILPQTDTRGICDEPELIRVQNDLIRLFARRCVEAAGRHLTARAFSGGSDPDRAWVDLQFVYFDDRTDEADTTPMMDNVEFDLTPGNL